MITTFANKMMSEEQRQALLQTVEYHRQMVPVLNKSTLALC